MRYRKPYTALTGALLAAEKRRPQKSADTGDTDLALLREYLSHDDHPQRVRLRELSDGGNVPVTGPDGLRRQLGALDLGYFGRAYLPHYFSRPSPAFHEELDAVWLEGVLGGVIPDSPDTAAQVNRQTGSRTATAAPRGHAKSTNLTFKGSLHAACYGYKRYIVIISDTATQAAGFLSAIREELEDNAALREDFPETVVPGKGVWREDVILTAHGVKLQAKGAAQKMRGIKHRNWRPDLIILDDAENDENVRTPAQREKLKSWFFKAVSKAGDTYTDIVVIGTILHYDSLLSHILKNPDYRTAKYKAVLSFAASPLWETWEQLLTDLSDRQRIHTAEAFYQAHTAEMDAGASVLWPDKLSYRALMAARITEGEASFNSEYQNEPINPEDCLFVEEWFKDYNPAALDFSEKRFKFYGFVDPSLGRTSKSDYSAIIVIAHDAETGLMYVHTADIERRHPDKIITDILELSERIQRDHKQRFTKFGVETNQFQWFLKEELAKASARAGIYLPIQEVRQTSDKVLRIQTLQPDIKNGYIQFNARHKLLLEQLRHFPMADHDDGPDALQGCRALIGKKRAVASTKKPFGL